MNVYRELADDELPEAGDLFVKGMRPSPSIRIVLRPLGEWDNFDVKRIASDKPSPDTR